MKVYRDKLERRLKHLNIEFEDVSNKIDDETKSQYELYIMKLELDGAIEALESGRVESKRDVERNLEDRFYMKQFEMEGALKAL